MDASISVIFNGTLQNICAQAGSPCLALNPNWYSSTGERLVSLYHVIQILELEIIIAL